MIYFMQKNIASFPQGAVSDPVLYNLHVYDRRIDDINRLRELSATKAVERVASSEMRRTFVAPGVKRTEVQYKDLIATLFVPPGEGPFPGWFANLLSIVIEFTHEGFGFRTLATFCRLRPTENRANYIKKQLFIVCAFGNIVVVFVVVSNFSTDLR